MPSYAAQEDLASLPVHIRDCIETFTRDWIVVKRNGEQFSRVMQNAYDGKSEPPFERYYYEVDYTARGETPPDSDKPTFEAGLIRVRSIDCSPHMPYTLSPAGRRWARRRALTTRACALRTDGGFSAISPRLSLPPPIFGPGGQLRSNRLARRHVTLLHVIASPFVYRLVDPSPPQLLVTAKEVRFQLEIEPFWCAMFLFDVKKGCRISEDFNFDLNPPNVSQLIHNRPV